MRVSDCAESNVTAATADDAGDTVNGFPEVNEAGGLLFPRPPCPIPSSSRKTNLSLFPLREGDTAGTRTVCFHCAKETRGDLNRAVLSFNTLAQ